jgi:hypothetical protein
LTGVTPDTLRVRERRYGTVTPFRSETGTRLYRQDDVGRLALIRRLVYGGDATSCVANRTRDELERWARGAELPQAADGSERPCRMVVLGASLADRLGQEPAGSGELALLGRFTEPDSLLARARALLEWALARVVDADDTAIGGGATEERMTMKFITAYLAGFECV